MGNTIPGPPTLRDGSIRPDAKDRTLEFYWEEPPAQMPPAEVSSYTLSCSFIPFSQSVNSSTFYIKVSSLIYNINYSFQITAANSNGESIPANFRTVQTGLVPNPITNPSATVLSNAVVQIGWTAPTPESAIPLIGWYVVQSISSSPSDPEIRISAYGNASTATISSLNTASMYAFNVYAVNDPGYSYAVSTIAVSPVLNIGDLYTYFNIVTVSGSNDYYYRIYNSQTGWGNMIDTGIDSTQYTYEGSNYIGGGSNYLFASFYNPTTSNYAVPFFNTDGISLRTVTWDGTNDNYYMVPNSFSNATFFSVNSNSGTGLHDLQLYQPNTGLYQSTSIVANYFTESPAVYAVPLQNSVVVLYGSASNTILNNIWPVTESTPLFLYEGNAFLESPPFGINCNTGMFNAAGINSTDYFDTVNYITEPSTYMTYTLPGNTYTNYYYPWLGGYGNNNGNNYFMTFYNSNTTLYDIYVWNNFSNSSNFSNPVILSNIGAANNVFGFVAYTYITYEATYATNALLVYDFDSNTYTSNQTGIGITYSVFENGSTYSTVFTSTNLALGSNFVINSNATGVLQLDADNNVGIALCSQVFGQSTIVLSTATGYLDSLSTFNFMLGSYTNFISMNLPQVDGLFSNFVTIKTDTGAITTFSTNIGINTQIYCASTGIVRYYDNSCDVLFNGIITSNIPIIDSSSYAQPDFALGYVYGSYYDGFNFTLYTAKPTGIITNTVTAFSGPPSYIVTPSGYFAWKNTPFTLMAQSLDDTQSFYSTYGAAGNTSNTNFFYQDDSACVSVYDSDTGNSLYVVYNYASNIFTEYTETDTIVQNMITTSPYYWGLI
jgi:hypothetical protein